MGSIYLFHVLLIRQKLRTENPFLLPKTKHTHQQRMECARIIMCAEKWQNVLFTSHTNLVFLLKYQQKYENVTHERLCVCFDRSKVHTHTHANGEHEQGWRE